MLSARLHIVLKIVVLSAVLVYFTGPTVVVNYCSMSESPECCCRTHTEQSAARTDAPTIAKEATPCFTAKIVGGLEDTRATVIPQDLPRLVTGDVVVLHTTPVAALSPLHTLSYSRADDGPPPRMDICIGGGSLLI